MNYNNINFHKDLRRSFPELDIQVDGGIDMNTIVTAAKAGANVFVSGTGIFKSEDPAKTIEEMKSIAREQGK